MEASIQELATQVEASAFSFNPPTNEQATYAWNSLSELSHTLLAQHKMRERIRCRISTRSLFTKRDRKSTLTHDPALGEQTVLTDTRDVNTDTRIPVDA